MRQVGAIQLPVISTDYILLPINGTLAHVKPVMEEITPAEHQAQAV